MCQRVTETLYQHKNFLLKAEEMGQSQCQYSGGTTDTDAVYRFTGLLEKLQMILTGGAP